MALRAPEPASRSSGSRLVWQCTVLAGLAMLAIAAIYVAVRPTRGTIRSCNPPGGFILQQRLVYQIEFESAVASDFAALFSNREPGLFQVFEVGLQGELAVTVLEANADHTSIVYQFRLTQAQFRADGQDDLAQSSVLQRELTQPVFGLLDGRGRIQSVRFDSATGPLAKNVARTLLAATQIVGPESDAGLAVGQWETEEDDPSGRLVARYQVESDGTVHKFKLHYLSPQPAKKSRTIVLTPTIQTAGESVATLDDVGCLSAISVTNAQSDNIQGKVVGQGTLRLQMHLLRKEESIGSELAALRTTDAEEGKTTRACSLTVVKSPEEGQLDIQRQELGGATLQKLLDDLNAAEASSPEEKNITRLFLKFKALAIIRPESCAILGELLTHTDPSSLKMHILTDAMEAADNFEAQAALSAAIQSRSDDWPALVLLIPALGAAESPTPQTEQTLNALAFGTHAKNISVTARLALGNVARNLRETSPERGKKIVDRILQELADPAAADSKWELLLALGNAGSVRALPTLTRMLDDSTPDLRGAAAWAMRWINSPQVDAVLTSKVLMSDPDRVVRLEAVRALRFREKTPANFAAEKKALAAEADADIRIELLRNLWDFRDFHAQIQQLTELAAVDDPAPSVRESAIKFLEQMPTMQ